MYIVLYATNLVTCYRTLSTSEEPANKYQRQTPESRYRTLFVELKHLRRLDRD